MCPTCIVNRIAKFDSSDQICVLVSQNETQREACQKKLCNKFCNTSETTNQRRNCTNNGDVISDWLIHFVLSKAWLLPFVGYLKSNRRADSSWLQTSFGLLESDGYFMVVYQSASELTITKDIVLL